MFDMEGRQDKDQDQVDADELFANIGNQEEMESRKTYGDGEAMFRANRASMAKKA